MPWCSPEARMLLTLQLQQHKKKRNRWSIMATSLITGLEQRVVRLKAAKLPHFKSKSTNLQQLSRYRRVMETMDLRTVKRHLS